METTILVLTALPRANDLRHAWPADFGSMPGSTFQMDGGCMEVEVSP